ncbi:MAG: NAD+ synthase [Planctomycetota bacterium]|nr:NAD+ synthase [Planctomycetota bacterium]
MRIAIAQLDLRIADFAAAAQAIGEAARAARAAGCDLLVTPELAAFGGYPPRDLLERRDLVLAQWRCVQELAAELALPTLVGCAEPLEPGIGPALANSLVLLADGRVVASYRKRLLPTYDVFDEWRYFRPGDAPLLIALAGRRIALSICEDIWTADFAGIAYRQDPLADIAGRCDVLVNASASPWHLGKPALRHRLLHSVARRIGAPVVYVNQVGGQDELLFDGDSAAIAPDGGWICAAPRWQQGLWVADLAARCPAPPAPHPLDDLHAALVTGIRDYCRKTGQQRVVLGLSGGIDSALTAALAVDALGADAVTGLLMPGPFSSPGSVSDARRLADNLGIQRAILPISELWERALAVLAPLGEPSDLTSQNLQARLRGTLVMAAANQLGAMALTTGNKSELATGYCTIYGDMNGGLAPLGDVYKTTVWELARRINERAGAERIPQASIDKAPSAELRPNQTDQDTLPPYPVLDRILIAYLEEGRSRDDLVAAGEDAATVDRVLRMVELSEFKRRQAAPALRVSRKAFGMGRRIPIARAC